MQTGAGQLSLDGDELATIALCDPNDEIRVEAFLSATARRKWCFGLICYPQRRSDDPKRFEPVVLKSPHIFDSEEDALGYGQATLDSARKAIEHLRAQSNE